MNRVLPVAMLLSLFVSIGAAESPGPARAASPSVPLSPLSCTNVPVKPSEVVARDCLWTGPESLIVTGGVRGTAADGRILTVDGARRYGFTLVGSGIVRLISEAGGRVCVAIAQGNVAVDTQTGRTSACPGMSNPPDISLIADGGMPAGGRGSSPTRAESPAATVSPRAAAIGPPAASTSSYVYGDAVAACSAGASTSCTLFTQGTNASAGALVIIDFGAPCYVPGTSTYGTQLFNTKTCTPTTTVAIMLANFVRGYTLNHIGGAPLILAAGTSNSLTGADPQSNYMLSTAQMQQHASAWFHDVIQPLQGMTMQGSAPITVWAASDMEQSGGGDYYGPDPTLPWLDQYAYISGHGAGTFPCVAASSGMLADYGDDVVGAGGWTQAHIYHAAFGSPVACAVPEIYYPTMATQWATTSQWAAGTGMPPIVFTGVMSENGLGGTLSANDSWNALSVATGQSPPYLTNISTAQPVGDMSPWIRRVYLDLLNRPVDAGGLAAWSAALGAGMSRSQVAASIAQSAEYDQSVVQSLYQQYLHRSADAGGLDFYARQLGIGVGVETVALAFAGSAEFYTGAGGGTDTQFVGALYVTALSRAVDTTGGAYWTQVLNGGASRRQVANSVLLSTERETMQVSSWYQRFLQRAPDAGGLSHAVGQLVAGETDQSLIVAFLASTEYAARAGV